MKDIIITGTEPYTSVIKKLTDYQRDTKQYPKTVRLTAETYNNFTSEQKFDIKSAGIEVKVVIPRPSKRAQRRLIKKLG